MAEQFKPRTQEEIHREMLDSIRDDVDKREGSVVYDMTAPTAFQVESLEYDILAAYLNGFALTADLGYLKLRAAEVGLDWKDAVKAVGEITISGSNGVVIPTGYQVYTENDIYFRTTLSDTIADGSVTLPVEAVEGGAQGNISPGEITQYENTVAGVTGVTNDEVFSGGLDAESRDSLLARYLLRVRKPITSGNVYQYELWATEVGGVAAAKVFPLWDGPGTVRVVVVGEDGRAPSQEIIDAVVDNIEAERPIGADVTVDAIAEIAININVDLTLDDGLLPADVIDSVEEAIASYLLSTIDEGIVRYTGIGNALLDVNGVIDYENLTINSGTANVIVPEDSVAVVGDIELN